MSSHALSEEIRKGKEALVVGNFSFLHLCGEMQELGASPYCLNFCNFELMS